METADDLMNSLWSRADHCYCQFVQKNVEQLTHGAGLIRKILICPTLTSEVCLLSISIKRANSQEKNTINLLEINTLQADLKVH